MENSNQIQVASKIITELQNVISIFLDQLSAEREILLTGNAQDLGSITDKKQDSISRLTSLEKDIAPIIKGINELGDSGDETALKNQWQHTIQQLTECQRMNVENSSLVSTRLKHTTNTLHQLHSLLDTNHSVIYTEDGNQHISSEPNRSVHA